MPAKNNPLPSKQNPAGEGVTIEHMLTQWPPLTDVQRDAFRAQFSELRCDTLGRRTESGAVYDDAVRFAKIIANTLRSDAMLLRRYRSSRYAWFLECIVALGRARSEQLASKDAPTKSVEAALGRANEVRRSVAHALDMLTGDYATDRAELANAMGDADRPDQVVRSLHDLAKLADQWLRHTDGETRALVASVDLRQGDIDLAWAAATDLENALDRASGKRLGATVDTPTVDRIEGRVLLEMRHAMAAFAFAHALDAAVPELVPGDATRAVLTQPMRFDGNGSPKPVTANA
jgi:hypothetical protein